MKQIKLFENGTSILKISELAIGNLMVLLAGLLGYLTGFLRGILGESKDQFEGSDEDNAYHSHGEFRRKILGPLDSRQVFLEVYEIFCNLSPLVMTELRTTKWPNLRLCQNGYDQFSMISTLNKTDPT